MVNALVRQLTLPSFGVFSFLVYAQTTLTATTCTVNGEEVPCPEVGGILGFGAGILPILAVISIATTVFWVLMLVHAIQHNIGNKALWIVLMLLTGVLVAIIYFFVVKRNTPKV